MSGFNSRTMVEVEAQPLTHNIFCKSKRCCYGFLCFRFYPSSASTPVTEILYMLLNVFFCLTSNYPKYRGVNASSFYEDLGTLNNHQTATTALAGLVSWNIRNGLFQECHALGSRFHLLETWLITTWCSEQRSGKHWNITRDWMPALGRWRRNLNELFSYKHSVTEILKTTFASSESLSQRGPKPLQCVRGSVIAGRTRQRSPRASQSLARTLPQPEGRCTVICIMKAFKDPWGWSKNS